MDEVERPEDSLHLLYSSEEPSKTLALPRSRSHGARFSASLFSTRGARAGTIRSQTPSVVSRRPESGFKAHESVIAMKNQLDQPSQIGGGKIAPDLAPLLRQREHFRHQAARLPEALLEFGAHRQARSMSRIDRAQQAALSEDCPARSVVRFLMTGRTGPFCLRASCDGALDGGNALVAERGQHVLLGGEIIEEGSLADVGGLGDGLDGGLLIAALGEEPQRGAEKPFAGFGAVALAAARAGLADGAERWK